MPGDAQSIQLKRPHKNTHQPTRGEGIGACGTLARYRPGEIGGSRILALARIRGALYDASRPRSCQQRSAPATIAARASAPRAIVAPYGAPGDKVWGAAHAPTRVSRGDTLTRLTCRAQSA